MHSHTIEKLNLRLFGEEETSSDGKNAEASSEAAETTVEVSAGESSENEALQTEPIPPERESTEDFRTGLILAHFERMERQAEAVRSQFPDFDLRRELRNPAFARMTAPDVGISVEDAYYAVHGRELLREAAEITAQRLSNAIVSGSRRPSESGVSSRAPSVSAFDYAKASRTQREEFKKDLRARMARGEKVYPRK